MNQVWETIKFFIASHKVASIAVASVVGVSAVGAGGYGVYNLLTADDVAEVVEGGSAAGVLQVDDVITAVDNKKVHKFSDLQEALAQHRPGDKVKVTVMRKKSEKTFDITLKNSQGNTKVVKSADMEILGAAFRAISDETKRQLNLSYGLEVTGVNKGKMQDAGIRKGFIIQKANNETIRSEEDLQTVLKQATQSPEQVLFISGIYPSGRRANYAVDLTQE